PLFESIDRLLIDREIGSHRLLHLLDDLGVGHEQPALQFLKECLFGHMSGFAVARAHAHLFAFFTICSSIVSTPPLAASNSIALMMRRQVSRSARAPRRFCWEASQAMAMSEPRVICRSIPNRLK